MMEGFAHGACAAALGALCLVVAPRAHAQDRGDARAVSVATVTQENDGYGYRFVDDPMRASVIDGDAPRIRVMPRALRQALVRPRTSFVPEMLTSIEKL